MKKEEVMADIGNFGILPVVRTANSADAVTIIDAVIAGGCRLIEVTMTIPGAVDVIRSTVDAGRNVLVGAGTVSSAAEAKRCIAAGARFIVSPWIEREVIRYCTAAGVLVIPGVLTPTEVRTAQKMGADMVKIFPASSMGGPPYIRALRSVMPGVKFIPTGGVSVENAADYIGAGAFAVGIGSDLVSINQVRTGDPSAISKISSLVSQVKDARAAATST